MGVSMVFRPRRRRKEELTVSFLSGTTVLILALLVL